MNLKNKLLLMDGHTIETFECKGNNPKPANDKLLTDNAFFLLANHQEILSDSRMFLAPIDVLSGLAYSGTSSFERPTLGIYIEWWMSCEASVLFLKDIQPNLLWHIAGSPLSGCNKCSCVGPDGVRQSIEVRDFSKVWREFAHINERYKQAKDMYEAYSLDEVIEKLNAIPGHKTVSDILTEMMTLQCIKLKERLEESKKKNSELELEIETAHTMQHINEIRPLYAELMGHITALEKDITMYQALHRDIKSRLHTGEITSKNAQNKISSLLERKGETIAGISQLKSAFSESIRHIDPMITLKAVEKVLSTE